MIIGMILFDNLTQLDLTGPYEVFWAFQKTMKIRTIFEV